jgi:molybdate transport system ATP-binding protein
MEVAQRSEEIATDKPAPGFFAAGVRDLELQIRKQFASREGQFTLDIAFTAKPEITIVFGASGAGKTTLLNCIAGLARPDSGKIAVARRIFFDSNNKINIAVQQRSVGYVLQDLALFPHMTAEENIWYGLASLSASERNRRSDAMLESFRISHLRVRKPREISGGERQRVALARTLVTDPCVLLLDEPLAALDAATKSKIIEDLRVWNETHHIPILYVTHSRTEVFALGERVLVLERGRVIADGVPHQVMTVPRQETVAQLVGFENIFHATVNSIHEDRGTMICCLADCDLELETPLVHAEVGSKLRIGIGAGDILLAASLPNGLSARNIIPGKMVSLAQRDVIVVARVDCGLEMEVHLTLAARDALHLQPGQPVWLVIKTHSCHLMAAPDNASQ